MTMVENDYDTEIIVDAIRSSGEPPLPETIACLEARDAPQPILAIAREMAGLLPAFPPKRDTEEEDEGQSAQVRTRELKLAQPVVAEPQQQPETKPTEHVWLRVGGGYVGGFYSYKEISEQSLGPIYNDPIILGFGEAPAAGTFGFQINAKAWLPQLPQVGFEGNVRRNDWGVVIPYGDLAQGEFSSSRWGSNRREENEVRDGMYVFTARLHGRLFTDVDSTRWSLGGHIGAHVSDFLYFKQEVSGVSDTLDFADRSTYADLIVTPDTLWVFSTTYGIEAGVEFGADWFANSLLEIGFSDYKAIFSDSIELELGTRLASNLYLSVSASRLHRSTPLYEGEENDLVGRIEDRYDLFGISLGYQAGK